uniref:Uncharacterized protein n=1 Tax=Helianthus annuus TaxID=4232 RepID=A0A251TYL7_HELAN
MGQHVVLLGAYTLISFWSPNKNIDPLSQSAKIKVFQHTNFICSSQVNLLLIESTITGFTSFLLTSAAKTHS